MQLDDSASVAGGSRLRPPQHYAAGLDELDISLTKRFWMRWFQWRAAFYHEGAVFGVAPKPIDVEHIRADAGDGDFEITLPLRCLEELTLFDRKSVADAAAANLRAGGLATAEPLDVVLVWLGHHDCDVTSHWQIRQWAGDDCREA